MEQNEDTSTMSSPFWVPNNNNRRLRRSYSLLLTSTSFLVLLLVAALVFGLVVIPTMRSFTSNIFKPNAVKHSWDSLNLILVLFAVVCGFLTKNDTNETQTPRFDNNYHHQRSFSNPATPPSWYEHSNRSFNRLRSFGSHPDLRQYSPSIADDEQCRFYDDTHPLLRHRYPGLESEDELVVEKVTTVTFGEVSGLPELQHLPPAASLTEAFRRNDEQMYQAESMEIPESNDLVHEISQPPPPQPPPPVVRKKKRPIATKENTATVTSAEFSASHVLQPMLEPQPPPLSAPPPPATRTKAIRRNAKRTHQVEMIEKPEKNDFIGESSQQPPPPLPAERKIDMDVKKKRGSATKEFLTSLRSKKKKQRQRSVENFESILLNSQPISQPPPSPPPPPPLPPPPSVFQNLFSSNKSKNKKHYLVPVGTDNKPKLPNKREHSYYNSLGDNNVMANTGNESPLIPIPPPPPPPPFKLPAWKFRVQGDYVRVDSIGSSRSGSPDFDEVVESPISQEETESSNDNSPYAPDEAASASASGASLFCPSPDVDTKAQNFIQSFRAGLRMAKMNSMKEKQGIGRSNLGPLNQKRN